MFRLANGNNAKEFGAAVCTVFYFSLSKHLEIFFIVENIAGSEKCENLHDKISVVNIHKF